MSVLHQLTVALEPWKTYWADHTSVSNAITAGHVVALLLGGGLAIAADRMTLRVVRRSAPERAMHAQELHDTHRPVVIAIAFIVLTGLLMLGSDIAEFVAKPIYWIKMGMVVLLLINGLMLQRAEMRVLAGTTNSNAMSPDGLWKHIALYARFSITLWIAITVAGIVLAG